MNKIIAITIPPVGCARPIKRPHGTTEPIGHAGCATAQSAQPAQPPEKDSEAGGRHGGEEMRVTLAPMCRGHGSWGGRLRTSRGYTSVPGLGTKVPSWPQHTFARYRGQTPTGCPGPGGGENIRMYEETEE